MLGAILSSVYFSCLVSFSFVSHPVVYCILLLTSALSVSCLVYLMVGFSWYLALFCLVYVGGVYVLFIFISVHSPNPVSLVGGSGSIVFIFFICSLIYFGGSFFSFPCFYESSHYLSCYFEGFSYCLFCLILMVGFISISVVMGSKDSFFR